MGDVPNYVEPFGATLGVLLSRPTRPRTETVNDADALLCNFWRAVRAAPEEVACFADYPVSEVDLNARHRWLVETTREVSRGIRVRVEADPDFYDAKAAGWWVWGVCQWIGPNFCGYAYRDPKVAAEGTYYARRRGTAHSHVKTMGKFPWRLPHLGNAGMGIHAPTFGDIAGVMGDLSVRLRRVRIACGDWRRVLTPAVTTFHGLTGVLLDPPYEEGRGDYPFPAAPGMWEEVARWAEENGGDPRLRIALCGYEGMRAPEGWRKHEWRAAGGYGARSDEGSRGRVNAGRERVWFSEHCLIEPSLPT